MRTREVQTLDSILSYKSVIKNVSILLDKITEDITIKVSTNKMNFIFRDSDIRDMETIINLCISLRIPLRIPLNFKKGIKNV